MKKNISKVLIIVVFMFGLLVANNASARVPNVHIGATSIATDGTSMINWSSSDVTECDASGANDWFGAIYPIVSGTQKVHPTTTTTYKITCTSTQGTVTDSVTITVTAASSGSSNSGSTFSVSKLSVNTNDATNITYTTATLNGVGGDSNTSSTLPLTAYFRYSKANISPIFCNDIYGTNMISTKDIPLGMTQATSFFQNITNLTPDTTYYYCAIISNKNVIAYGGSSIVKSFHTSPYGTTVSTRSATNTTSDSVTLNASFSSIENVTTYFQYKKTSTDNTTNDWYPHPIGTSQHLLGTNSAGKKNSNVYGNITADLAGLTPNTAYQFRAVGYTCSGSNCSTPQQTSLISVGAERKIFYGSTLNFKTSSVAEDTGNGNGTSDVTCTPPYVLDPITKSCTFSQTNSCLNKADNYPLCSTINGSCLNGANNPPDCSTYDTKILPTVTITASPTLISSGETSTISWSSTGTTSCDAGDGNGNGKIGSFNTGSLVKSKTYSVTCVGVNGSASDYVTVTVTGGITNGVLPTVKVLATPSSISSGETSTIGWSATNVTSCNAGSGNGTGITGSFNTGKLTKSKSYSVTCTGDNGRVGSYAYVYVAGSNNTSGGTWGTGTDSGTWKTTLGTMGDKSTVTWTGTGNGSGTWRSSTGSGTWSNGRGTGGAGTGTWSSITSDANDTTGVLNTTPLTLGQTATPPSMDVVRSQEGIETVFARQIMADTTFAKMYGYIEGNDLQTFAWDLADQLARMFGYVSTTGKEIRVSLPDVAAYQLQQIGNKLTVYEYYNNKIVDVRNATATLKSASGYEYYFKK